MCVLASLFRRDEPMPAQQFAPRQLVRAVTQPRRSAVASVSARYRFRFPIIDSG